MDKTINPTDKAMPTLGKAERDVVALGIAVAALILFVGTGGTVMPKIIRAWMGGGAAPDMLLTNAVLLNIALLIFGWRRYSDLQQEVAERRKAEERAQRLAQTDPLTGCLNRRSCGAVIEAMCLNARHSKRDVAVLMVDLDNFKQINDLNGHKTGDIVLVEVTRRIREILPETGMVARIGGDEFICALQFDPRHSETVDDFAARLIEQLSQSIHHDNLRVEVTASVGVARASDQDKDSPVCSDDLIHHADVAMYYAKKHGRNRYFWFQRQMEEEQRSRLELESGIRRGIARGEFVPYYEQQIDLGSGELVGFEMLARWNSPQLGLVGPEVFIPVAEEIDVISELSEALIAQALLDARDWDPRLTLSVNISPVQFRDPWFAQRMLRLLADHGFPASRLEIEITESCLKEDIGAVRSVVSSLKNQGVRISLDDFGTGYSSLSRLRALPFDRLKIDRSFVAELNKEGVSSSLVKAMVSLGRGLSLPLTAEGIENTDVLSALRDMGELKGQGYLYGQPEDGEATRTRLRQLHMLARENAGEAAQVSRPASSASERKAS